MDEELIVMRAGLLGDESQFSSLSLRVGLRKNLYC